MVCLKKRRKDNGNVMLDEERFIGGYNDFPPEMRVVERFYRSQKCGGKIEQPPL